eukprot:14258015-Alexandrium_andersonii.AAC.1
MHELVLHNAQQVHEPEVLLGLALELELGHLVVALGHGHGVAVDSTHDEGHVVQRGAHDHVLDEAEGLQGRLVAHAKLAACGCSWPWPW